MKLKSLHPNFKIPTKGTEYAGAYDLYMPIGGALFPHQEEASAFPLGFAAEVPEGHVALILPRSGAGGKKGLSLNNTCGVIDSDYRGEWVAWLRVRNHMPMQWEAGDRLLQMLIIPIASVQLEVVDELNTTERDSGGFGSTGA